MIDIKRHIRLTAAALTATAALSSCEDDYFRKEPEFPAGEEYTDEITFGMSLPEDWNPLGRSAADDSASWVNPEPVETGVEIDGKKLYLSLSVSDMTYAPQPAAGASASAAAASRGGDGTAPFSRDVSIEDVKDFGIYAYLRTHIIGTASYNSTFDMYMQNTRVYKDDNDKYIYSPLKYWPGFSNYKYNYLRFMAYMPYIADISATSRPLSIDVPILDDFNFSTEAPTYPYAPKLTYTVPDDASEGIDVLAAAPSLSAPTIGNYESYEFPGDYRKLVNFEFKHLLSEIKFKAGSIADGVISGIGLHNVYGKGEASLDETAMRPLDAADKSFTQTFDPGFGTGTAAETQIGVPFYLIPQVFADDKPSLRIDLKFAGKVGDRVTEYTIKKPLREFSAEWLAGKTYSYTLSVPQEVDVTVNDIVEKNVKKNLEIKNTGLSTVFIRAAIIGSWVLPTEDPNRFDVVAGWDEADTSVGHFDWGGADASFGTAANDKWFKGSDGFYYYIAKVAPGVVLPPLFKTYEVTGNAPMVDAQLELNIVAQAVLATELDINGTGWNTDAVTALKKLQ